MIKHILLSTDFSEASQNALSYVKEMISGTDAKVDLIHVYDLPLFYSTQTPSRAIQGYLEELSTAAKRRLQEAMDTLPEVHHGVCHAVYGMYPSSEIEELADRLDVDLIVMALRQDYGIMRRLIGNTTARTIHKSDKPVMAIPATATFKPINNILFPTALANKDSLSPKEEAALSWLNVFLSTMKAAEIELLHIEEDTQSDAIDVSVVSAKFKGLRMTYSHAWTAEEGIYEYMSKKLPDLIAFYKPHRTFWERLYRPPSTRHLLYDSKAPLIIF